MQVDSVDASHIDNWRNGAMTFDKVPLEEIAKELKRLYNIPIRIESDKLKQIVYYSDFQENVSVEKVLEILSSGNKFRYEIKSEEIRIFNKYKSNIKEDVNEEKEIETMGGKIHKPQKMK